MSVYGTRALSVQEVRTPVQSSLENILQHNLRIIRPPATAINHTIAVDIPNRLYFTYPYRAKDVMWICVPSRPPSPRVHCIEPKLTWPPALVVKSGLDGTDKKRIDNIRPTDKVEDLRVLLAAALGMEVKRMRVFHKGKTVGCLPLAKGTNANRIGWAS